jgi:hypothetical protein
MRLFYVALFSLLVLSGCTGKVRLLTETKQYGSSLEVKVNVEPPSKGTLTFKGNPAFEKLGPQPIALNQQLVVNVPLAGVAKGTNKVTMEFTGEGRGVTKKTAATSELSFERKASAPSLTLVAVPKPGATNLSCRGALCASGTTLPLGADARLSVDLTSCDGCDVDVGGQKIAVRGAHAVSSIDLTNAIGNASGSEVTGDMKLSFKITLEGETSDVPFEALGSLLAGTVFKRILQGPVHLAGEAAGGPPKSAIIVRKEAGYGVIDSVGSAAHVRDFDLVGIATTSDISLGSCGTYEKSDTKAKVNIEHRGLTYDITMYDRRTAKSLGRRSIAPENTGCGDKLSSAGPIFAYPASSAIQAWARTFLK